jgi:hypothetical protein
LWLDLRLKGIEPESIWSTEKSLLMGHLAKKRDQRFLETMLIINAVIAAASAASGAKQDFEQLKDMIKKYTDLLYPEDAHELEDKTARIKSIMEKEHARGPMIVQAQDYDKKRRKKRK